MLAQSIDAQTGQIEFGLEQFARDAGGEASAQLGQLVGCERWSAAELDALGARTSLAFFGALVDEVAFKTGDGTEN